jgi:hypothetical protein
MKNAVRDNFWRVKIVSDAIDSDTIDSNTIDSGLCPLVLGDVRHEITIGRFCRNGLRQVGRA